jgi:hypothetical protein
MKRSLLSEVAGKSILSLLGVVLLLTGVLIHPGGVLVPSTGVVQLGIIRFDACDGLKSVWLQTALRFLFLLGIGVLVQFLSNRYRLIRIRSFFPLFVFSLTVFSLFPLLVSGGGLCATLFLVLAGLRLFAAQEHGLEGRAVFDASLLLAAASIFQPHLLLLAPAFWLVMAVLQVFNVRFFLASLFGLLCVFWLVAGLGFLLENNSLMLTFWAELCAFELLPFTSISTLQTAYLALLLLLFLSAVVSFWPKQHLDKLKTRNYLNSVLILLFFLIAIWLFSGSNPGYLLPLLAFLSLFIAHFFSLEDTLYAKVQCGIFLLLSVVVSLQ